MPSDDEVEPARLFVEQSQHDTLAMARRNRRDADVHRAARDAQADPAILRQALLRDVETRHHLDARDQERRDRALGLQHFAQHAVHAEAHHEAVLEWLDVDVRGVFLDRLGQHGVDQADDWRVVLALEQVRRLGQALCEAREVGFVLDALDDLSGLAAAAFIGLAQQVVECRGGHAFDHERHAEEAPQLRDCGRLRALAVDDLCLAVDDGAHQDAMAFRKREGQASHRGDRPWWSRSRTALGHSPGPLGPVAMSWEGGGEAGAGWAVGGAAGPIRVGNVGLVSPGISLTLPLFCSSCRLRK